MTERERFIRALERKPITGRVPTFELVFFLTLEAVGRVHPSQRHYGQWHQMTVRERELHLWDMASSYIDVARKYHHSAIFVHPNPGGFDDVVRLLELIRERTGDEYYLTMHGDPTFSIPDGDHMMDFSVAMLEDAEALKAESARNTDRALAFAQKLRARGAGLLDGFTLCSDYCLNTNPFFSPDQFAAFVAPDLRRVIAGYREMGYYTIKHTDGNIMPILDQMVDCAPHALHSIDPQAGVSLAKVKALYGDRVALCGNVNCGLLQTGANDDVIADTRRALREGMPGFGYIFCTSNCAYTGMPLERYELMHDVWYREGVYPAAPV